MKLYAAIISVAAITAIPTQSPSHCNLDEDEYEFDDLICIDNSSEWHVRAYIGTEAYWVFFYRDCRREQ